MTGEQLLADFDCKYASEELGHYYYELPGLSTPLKCDWRRIVPVMEDDLV